MISGWICYKFLRSRPVRLHIYLDDTCVGQVTADDFRKDVLNFRLHPTGRCGFTFTFPEHVDVGSHKKVTVRYGGLKSTLLSVKTSEIPAVFKNGLPKIFFMHIPKTAGTSFNNFVRLRYPAEAVSARLEAEEPSHYPRVADEKSYLAGHLTFGEFKTHFDSDQYALYTIVREPWRHLHSHLNWVRGVGKDPQSGFYQEHPQCVRELSDRLNDQKTEIAEVLRRLVEEMDGFEFDFFDNRQTRYFLDYRPDKVEEKDLLNALENVRCFSDIGRTEQYQRFVARFCQRYGLPFIQQEQSLNRSKHTPLYDIEGEEYKAVLRPLVHYDLQLYAAIADMEQED